MVPENQKNVKYVKDDKIDQYTGMLKANFTEFSDPTPESTSVAYDIHKKYNIPLSGANVLKKQAIEDEKIENARKQLEDGYFLVSPPVNELINNPNKFPVVFDQIKTYKELDQVNNAINSGIVDKPEASILSGYGQTLSSVFTGVKTGAKQFSADLDLQDSIEYYKNIGDTEKENYYKERQKDILNENAFEIEKAQLLQNLYTPSFDSKIAADVYEGSQSVLQSAPAILGGLAAGGATLLGASFTSPAVAVPLSIKAGQGAAYSILGLQTFFSEYMKYRKRGGDIDQATLGAGLEAGAEIIGEAIPISRAINFLGKTKFKQAIFDYFVVNGITEQATTLAQGIIDTAIANPDKTFGDYFKNDYPEQTYKTFVASMVGGAFFGGTALGASYIPKAYDKVISGANDLSSSVLRSETRNSTEGTILNETAEEISKISFAENSYKALFQINETIEKEGLKERNKSILSDFIKDMTNQKLDTVYIDKNLLLDSGLNFDQFQKDFPDLFNSIMTTEEDSISSDIEIPLNDFLINFSGTEYIQKLLEIARLDLNGISFKETVEGYGKEKLQQIEQEAKLVSEEKQRYEDFKQSSDLVYKDIKNKLSLTGLYNTSELNKSALFTKVAIESIASNLGMMPDDFYKQYGFKINESIPKTRRLPEKTIQVNGNEQNILGEYIPETKAINLFRGAKLDTFLHELAHWYLDVVLFGIASTANAPSYLVDDLQTTLKYLKIDSIEGYKKLSDQEQSALHEKFAESFQVYLFEGKSPTRKLKIAFNHFKTWMILIYRNLFSPMDRQMLTDEVRQVFDHMVLSQNEIVQAQKKIGLKPMFSSAEEAGMTEDEYQNKYMALWKDGDFEAIKELEIKQLKNMQYFSNAVSRKIKKLQSEHKDLRKIIKKQIQDDLYKSNRDYRLYEALTVGRVYDENYGKIKLDLSMSEDIAKNIYGDFGIDLSNIRSYFKKDGASPYYLADILGFDSVEELIVSIDKQIDFSKVIEDAVSQQLVETFGNRYDKASIEREAVDSLHNQYYLQVIHDESRALHFLSGKTNENLLFAKQQAKNIVNNTKISSLSYKKFLILERKFANEASKIYSEIKKERNSEKIGLAASAKRKQLIAHLAYIEARDIKDSVQKSIKTIKSIEKDIRDGKLRGEGLSQLKFFLEKFDFRVSIKADAEPMPIKSLAEYIQESALEKFPSIDPEGLMVDLLKDPQIADHNFRRSYKDLTAGQFLAVIDTVKNLHMIAKKENEMFLKLKNLSFSDEKESILDNLKETYPEFFDEEGKVVSSPPVISKTKTEKIKDIFDSIQAEKMNPEATLEILSGGAHGQLKDSIWQRLSDASDRKTSMFNEVNDKYFKKIFRSYSLKDIRDFKNKSYSIQVSYGSVSLTRENAVMLAAHYGNETGRTRIRENMRLTDADVVTIIDSILNEKDISFVNTLWLAQDEYIWPQLKELNERTLNFTPEKVEPISFSTSKFKNLRGGYVPLSYHGISSSRLNQLSEMSDLAKSIFNKTSKTRQGTSKQRFATVDQDLVLRLDLASYQEKMNLSIHDISFREAASDVSRLLNSRRISRVISKIIGDDGVKSLRQWVMDAARPPFDPSGWLASIVNTARKNTIINLLSGINTAILNFTGLIPAISEVGLSNMSIEILKFLSNQRIKSNKSLSFAKQESAYLRNRFDSFDRDAFSIQRNFSNQGSVSFYINKYSLYAMGIVDEITSGIVWNAALRKGLKSMPYPKAVSYADSIVRQTQGSGRDVDLSQIMRDTNPFKKAFTMLFSYFNAMYSFLIKTGAISKQKYKQNKFDAIGFFSLRFMYQFLIPSILFYAISDSEDPWYTAIPKELFKYMSGMFLFGRMFSPLVPALSGSDDPFYGLRVAPIQSAVESIGQAAFSQEDIIQGEGDIKDVKKLIMAGGYIFGYPGKLISDATLGTYEFLNGNAGLESIFLGPPKK